MCWSVCPGKTQIRLIAIHSDENRRKALARGLRSVRSVYFFDLLAARRNVALPWVLCSRIWGCEQTQKNSHVHHTNGESSICLIEATPHVSQPCTSLHGHKSQIGWTMKIATMSMRMLGAGRDQHLKNILLLLKTARSRACPIVHPTFCLDRDLFVCMFLFPHIFPVFVEKFRQLLPCEYCLWTFANNNVDGRASYAKESVLQNEDVRDEISIPDRVMLCFSRTPT